MTIEKQFPSGALLFSQVVAGQLVEHKYMGYTKREATRLFREKVRALRKPRKK